MANSPKLAFVRAFLQDVKPCNRNDFSIFYKGVLMNEFLDKLFARRKVHNDANLRALFQEFPVLYEFTNKTIRKKDDVVVYVGFEEEATREETDLLVKIRSLKNAIVYAQMRLAHPDKLVLKVVANQDLHLQD